MSVTPKTMWPAVKTMLHSVYDQPDDIDKEDLPDSLPDPPSGDDAALHHSAGLDLIVHRSRARSESLLPQEQ